MIDVITEGASRSLGIGSIDANGNITKIVSGNIETRYVYDDLGQLLREDNGENQRTYLYTYDDAGNMTSKVDYPYTAAGVTPSGVIASYSYGYSTGTWGDMLTSYNGNSITYDSIGNPLSYYNGASYTFGWTGRQLTSATRGSVSMTFKYNDEGMRTSKTVGGVVTKYYYNGDRLLAEEMGGRLITYIYDANGSPIGMTHRLASYAEDVFDVYWYQKNLQGDVIAVYDNSGTKLVTYTYDAWGRHSTSYFNNGASTPASYNRIRYRGYYYDTDLYLYYLGSRYYDSNTCRFINADGQIAGVGGEVLGYNVYAYCMNNPVNMSDHSGNWPSWATKVVVAAAIVTVVAVVAAVTVATAGAGTAAAVIAVGAAKGAAVGLVTGAAIGAGTAVVNHRVSTGSWEGADRAALEGAGEGALSGAITGAVTGAISSSLKIAKAAKSWNSGTFKSGYDSMNHHYKNKVLGQGYGKGNNVIKYTNDALDFANINSSNFKYQYSAKYNHSRWFYSNSSGGGYFSNDGNIFTFWYKR